MINLTKDSGPVVLTKDRGLRCTLSWPALTDYDVGCEILYHSGETESLAAFAARKGGGLTGEEVPPSLRSKNGTVIHNGDAGRGAGMAQEVITVAPDSEIKALAFWAYSAQSNGTGSFKRYGVSLDVTDGVQRVHLDAADASDNDTIYTYVPALVRFRDGVPQIEYVGAYSTPGSENRPGFVTTRLPLARLFADSTGEAEFRMDSGRRNTYK